MARVIVTGLVATYPVAGVAFDYLQYVQGFRALGWDVFYLEDTGQWFYDPARETFTPEAAAGARFLASAMAALDPAGGGAWAVREPAGEWHGRGAAEVTAWCASADLFLNLSGSCWLRDDYRRARRTAYVDTDPCYSQAKLAAVAAGTAGDEVVRQAALIRAHDVFFTLGEHVGAPDCHVPTAGIAWRHTRQPIALENWRVTPIPPDAPFTTVMSWRIEPAAPVVDGRALGGKDVEFERFVALPARVGAPLEVALSGAAPRDRLLAAGWRIRDARAVSSTLAAYRDYIEASRGEVSVAKNAYVAPRSGWFSTRSAAYLASGRPVILQDTGFAAHLPVGPGLQPFTGIDEAAAAVAAVAAAPGVASAHARSVAEECFDAGRVLGRLVAEAGL